MAGCRAPHLASLAALGGGDADGPGQGLAYGREGKSPALVGDAREGDFAAVGRPYGVAVPVQTRVQVADGAVREPEHADEGVISPIAHEGQPVSVG